MEKQLLKNLFELYIKEEIDLDIRVKNTPSLDLFVECLPDDIKDNPIEDLSYGKRDDEDYLEAHGFYFFKMFYVYVPEHQEWFMTDDRDEVTEKLREMAPELEDEFNFESPEDRNSDR
jgi:hypothetical protein